MGRYRHLLSQNPGTTLGAALEFAQEDFRDDFLELWGLEAAAAPADKDHDDWLEAKRVYGMAKQIAEIARLLLKRKGVGPQRLQLGQQLAEEARSYQKGIDDLVARVADCLPGDELSQLRRVLDSFDASDPRARRSIFENTLQLEAAKLLPRTLDEVASRLERLAEFVVAARGERTNSYLARVATCYCLGLRAELAVMARAVLDAALQEFLPDDELRKHTHLRRNERVQLGHRLSYVESMALAQPAATKAMRDVKDAGDNAIHLAPGTEPEPDKIMNDLLSALNAVERFGTHRERKGNPE